jgi:hypothetical protein
VDRPSRRTRRLYLTGDTTFNQIHVIVTDVYSIVNQISERERTCILAYPPGIRERQCRIRVVAEKLNLINAEARHASGTVSE